MANCDHVIYIQFRYWNTVPCLWCLQKCITIIILVISTQQPWCVHSGHHCYYVVTNNMRSLLLPWLLCGYRYHGYCVVTMVTVWLLCNYIIVTPYGYPVVTVLMVTDWLPLPCVYRSHGYRVGTITMVAAWLPLPWSPCGHCVTMVTMWLPLPWLLVLTCKPARG